MRIVLALGGNALLHRGEPLEVEVQRRNIEVAAENIAKLAVDHALVITHGNGPQVGLLALEAEAYEVVDPYPLDVLGAETQGMVGYLLIESLGRLLPSRRLACVLTRVLVDEEDPAFGRPTKPIGPTYDEASAGGSALARGWAMARDGDTWRRVVPSPEPTSVLDLDAIRLLADAGLTVVCSGGGGIPMVAGPSGLRGVEGVIDKDLTSVLVAQGVDADQLVMLTDVEGVYVDWGTASQRLIETATPNELRSHRFASGSMGPKVEAACRFVERTGRVAVIGALTNALDVVAGRAGTRIEG